jgi:ribosomal protein L11 methylase PrmA
VNYHALRFETNAKQAEAWSDALLDLGALSVDLSDPHVGTDQETPQYGEPGATGDLLWPVVRIDALFAGETADATLNVTLAHIAATLSSPLPLFEIVPIAERDWVRETQAQFGPIAVTEDFWIVPTWSTPPVNAQYVLRLDPGLAFGTGSHPTTQLCLKWLREHFSCQAQDNNPPPPSAAHQQTSAAFGGTPFGKGARRGQGGNRAGDGENESPSLQGESWGGDGFSAFPSPPTSLLQGERWAKHGGMPSQKGIYSNQNRAESQRSGQAQCFKSVLDYGCGSGILLLAARLFGAGAGGTAFGTDIDPQALIASRENAAANRLDAVFVAPGQLPERTFDLVIANILANPLRALAPLLAGRTAIGGRLILSGVLEDQQEELCACYAPWFEIAPWQTLDGWVLLSGIKCHGSGISLSRHSARSEACHPARSRRT